MPSSLVRPAENFQVKSRFPDRALAYVQGVWEIKNFMLKHEGHISTAGKRAIGGKELTRLPEVVDRLAEFEAAKIPSKYLGYLMQYRFSQKYQFRAETLKLLASTQGPRP